MAQYFTDQATAQLAPLYDQQVQAQQAQIPAIQQLYQSLLQGLEGTKKVETQNILESAGQRGVLRSTMPVDLQTQLAGTILQQQGQYGAQQAKDIAGIQSNIGQIQLAKATGIQQLADTLYNQDLKQQALNAEIAAQQQQASSGGGRSGGGGGSAKAPSIREANAEIFNYLSSKAGRDGYVSPNVYRRVKGEFLSQGFNEKQWLAVAKRFKNPNTKY